ncbi:M15 family metallopeptidase [Atribacter laminatus]|uniref:D-alanyl-D-alanine dipeptidase n=1 Tax=Atribacter laminatus TaxID=2847778 RepID=A0A7T1AP94_ATRLM|nr:M15 family metallopeptidase [Atribacter laminatus]QPM69559.1 D-alanyl-D-alanine dipeptidase [Atribacter laminatus]
MMRFKSKGILLISLIFIFLAIQVGFAQQLEPPPAEPSHWTGLIGTYSLSPQDGNTFYLRENQGRLEILFPLVETQRKTESLVFQEKTYEIVPLKEIESDIFQLPPVNELGVRKFRIIRDQDGFAITINAGKKEYQRQFYGPEKGKVFKIQSVKSLEELRSEALKTNPPIEKGEFLKVDLVELIKLDKNLKLDIRYATENNFMGIPLYSQPRAFLQRPVAEALVKAHKKLRAIGYGLIVFDAYRPWYVTKMFWDATPISLRNFVADPKAGSRHNRGGAVDVGLYDIESKEPIFFGGDFDEFSERSFVTYPGGTSRQRWFREILRQALEAEGFEVYEDEWWHFDYKDSNKYPIINILFEDIR